MHSDYDDDDDDDDDEAASHVESGMIHINDYGISDVY